MKYLTRTTMIACFVLVASSYNAVAEFRAGAAKRDITPAVGVSLNGSISKPGPVQSIHDPLHARALVLDDGATQIAIVICDLCMAGQDVYDHAKKLIHEETKIPVSHILIASTHTHAAPRAIHIGKEPIDDEYHRLLAENIAKAVIEAHGNLQDAQIGYTSFNKPKLIACRRFLCKPGTVAPNVFGELDEQIKSVAGKSTGILEPAGPTDPQFSVLSVQTLSGEPICLLGNFSVHYCGGYQRGAVSADYFGYFSQAIEAKLQTTNSQAPEVIGMMSNGTSGNTGAFQKSAGVKFAPFEGMLFYGRLLAEQAVQSAQKIAYQKNPKIQIVQRELKLNVRRPDVDRLQWAKQLLASPNKKGPHRWSKIYANAAVQLSKYPQSVSIKLQTIRIGNIAIAACPCEVFAETGLAIKKESPFPNTFTIELANGYGGYLPPKKQHELGGYETWPAQSSFLETGAEEKIRTELLSMLKQLAN